jgi:hypothetical protein
MTISNQVSSVTTEGNGSTSSFTYTFKIPTTASCRVQVYDTTVDPATLVTVTSSAFTVTGIGANAGGVVTYPLSGALLSTGQYLTISRILPIIQTTAIAQQASFYPVAVENALDTLTMICQQLNTAIQAVEDELENPPAPVTPDNFQMVDTIGALRQLSSSNGALVYVQGHTTAGDGGAGFFRVTTTNPGTDDNGYIVHLNETGFYAVRQLIENTVSPRFWGAIGDGVTNDTVPVQSAFTWARTQGGGTVKLDGQFIVAPASDGDVIILVGSNTICVASSADNGVKVKNNAGNYQAVFAEYNTAVENVVFDGFTIDQNASGNTTCNVTPNVLTRALTAIYFTGPTITVRNMTILETPGVNTFSLNGVSATDIVVDSNTIRFVEGTSTTSLYDNSAIYINATNWQVTNNKIINDGTVGDAITGIETHGSYGQITGNQVSGYFTMGLVVTNGTTATSHVTVTDNVADLCRNGWTLWSETSSSISAIVVSNNVLNLTASAFPSSVSLQNGIGLLFDSGTTGAYENIEISSNVITFQAINEDTIGESSGGIAIETYGTMARIKVHDNIVKNAPWSGIVVRNLSGTAAREISIRDNYLIDCGNNTQSAQRYSVLFTGVVVDSEVIGNQVIDTGATLSGSTSFSFSNLGAGSFLNERDNRSYSITATTSQTYDGSLLPRPEKTQLLTWTASMIPVVNTGATRVEITASTTASCTIFSPAVEQTAVGCRVKFYINNTSGGTLALSWSGFKMETWTQPTSGQASYIEFENRGSGGNWYQCSKQVVFTK